MLGMPSNHHQFFSLTGHPSPRVGKEAIEAPTTTVMTPRVISTLVEAPMTTATNPRVLKPRISASSMLLRSSNPTMD